MCILLKPGGHMQISFPMLNLFLKGWEGKNNMTQMEGWAHATLSQISSLQDVLSLKGKVAIVTGGAMGLGYNIVNRLCEAGAKVVIADVNERLSEKAVSEFINDKGYDVAYAKTDIRCIDEINAAVDFTVKKYGRLDILVNNAALQAHTSYLDMSEEKYDNMFDTNLKGTYFFGQAAARHMVENGTAGKIINISSDAAAQCDVATGTLSHYGTAKAGVVALTTAMARELNQYGIRVNCVAPGGMNTLGAITSAMGADAEYPGILKKFSFDPPNPVSKTPDEVALMVYILATGVSDFIVGETIYVDGGARYHLAQEPFRAHKND